MTETAKNNATVLLVEDDVLVRMPIAAYLRHCGYRVVEAANSDEALVVLGQPDANIDVVLADAEVQNGAGGFAIAKWARANAPHLKVILAGSPSRAAEQAGELCSKGPQLTKPYDHVVVETTIRQLLSAREKMESS